ncbi:hypothetical protein Dsin_030720 [Dipteronia sinensis]|uniref:Uncharacterized protein n=1 Tax=Dipteronia sinensis TaxID=43782 RepID=A0AAD9ZLL6_9ROSI|nr:hypothetical protein Dsin_030720 [Dipteronia sinensis]
MPGFSTMVFTRTCDATRFLALLLRNLGQRAIPISGQMNQDYRVGRTTRAGRSGGAISLVNQYELEWFLQIAREAYRLTVYHVSGKKLPEFPADEDEVLLLLERVTEANRISITTIKESVGNKRRRGDGDNDNDDNIERSLGINNNNNKKQFNKKRK